MEVDSSKADQEDLVVKSMLGDDGYAHDGSLEMFNEYWNNIDDWTDTSKIGTGIGAEYYDFVPNHEKMLQECLNFDGWAWMGESRTNLALDYVLNKAARVLGTGQTPKEVLKRFKENITYLWDEEKKMFVDMGESNWPRYFANPLDHPDSFPTICKWLNKNKHKYARPVISRLGPGGTIIPHRHNLIRRENRVLGRMLYNMCINFPEGCKFAVHPNGLIPYKPGDVYKIWVHESMHSVINNSKEDRYHIMLRPSNYKEYVPEVS